MVLWTIAATAAALIITLIWIAYRRQVKILCRHLAFLEKYTTNLRLTSELPFTELNELIDAINDILEHAQGIQRAAQLNENNLKETITSLSHDIRTPLTSMDGYFQLLSQCESAEEREHYISIIQNRIGSLKDMLEALFTYTKLQNENYELTLERIDFSKCVYDTVFSYYDEFAKKEIAPTVDFCDSRIFIVGNEDAICRVLQNIVKNTLEHGDSKIILGLHKQNNTVIFRCSNDVQAPEEIDMNQIFSRFYKADSARTHSSTGLGLSIAKGLTEKMNGKISAKIESSLFTIEVCFNCSSDNGCMD